MGSVQGESFGSIGSIRGFGSVSSVRLNSPTSCFSRFTSCGPGLNLGSVQGGGGVRFRFGYIFRGGPLGSLGSVVSIFRGGKGICMKQVRFGKLAFLVNGALFWIKICDFRPFLVL